MDREMIPETHPLQQLFVELVGVIMPRRLEFAIRKLWAMSRICCRSSATPSSC